MKIGTVNQRNNEQTYDVLWHIQEEYQKTREDA